MFTTRKVKHAVANLNATFSALNRVVLGRQEIIRQLMYAVMCREHLLMEGSPGIAKSKLAKEFIHALTGCKTFTVACSKKMTEEYLVGPLDMRLFREYGIYHHRTENTLVDAHYAFVDEIFDLTPNTARALLEILNERSFSRGTQHVKAPLRTVIAATNFSGDDKEELHAVLDRFIFRAKVLPLSDSKQRVAMIRGNEHATEVPRLDYGDLRLIQSAVDNVVLPDDVVAPYVDICSHMKVTDRTVARCVRVLKANAVFSGRMICNVTDLSVLDSCLSITNDPTSKAAFSKAMSAVYSTAHTNHHRIGSLMLLGMRARQLMILANDAETYDAIMPIAAEVMELLDALGTVGSVVNSSPETSEVHRSIEVNTQAVLTKADTLHAASATRDS